MQSVIQDMQFAWKQIRGAPRFSLFIILLLALGLGLNLAIFSLLDALLLKPLPVRDPYQLVRLVQILPNLGARSLYTYRAYELLREKSETLTDIAGYSNLRTAVRDRSGLAHRVHCQVVTGNFFTALGVRALHGRVLIEADAVQNTDSLPAVLSYPYWQRRFLGAAIIGTQIRLQDVPFTVVGILPEGFNGLQVETSPDVRVPLIAADRLEVDPQLPSYRDLIYEVFARLRPDGSLEQAEAEAQFLYLAAQEDEPDDARLDARVQAQAIPRGLSVLREKYSTALILLMAGVALVLVMICANVGGLLLARSTARQQEAAIRLSLGATAGRLIRQWLTESFLLVIVGGAIGLGIAWLAIPLLMSGLPTVRGIDTSILTFSLNLKLDHRLLLFSLGLCCVGALLAGLPSALQAGRSDIYTTLRAARSPARQSFRWGLVAVQAGLCTLLLGGAALLISTHQQLRSMDPGFDSDQIITFSADPRMLAYTPQQVESLKSRLLSSVAELPDVESAAISSVGLLRGTGIKTTIAPAGERTTQSDFLNTSLHWVSPEYFVTMGMQLLAGRAFRSDEQPTSEPIPVIVNSTFARHFYPNVAPVGQKFGVGMNEVVSEDYVIVGIVSDAKYRSLREPIQPTIYSLWSGSSWMGLVLHIRTRGQPQMLIAPVHQALYAIDPRLPFHEVRTLAEEIDASLWGELALARLSGLFSLIAAGLAAMAVYGTLAFAISVRKREIGIRMALGARTAHILARLFIYPMVIAAIGTASGVGIYYTAMPVFGSVLYGISHSNPTAVLVMVAVMLLVASVATLLACRRALQVAPAEVLGAE